MILSIYIFLYVSIDLKVKYVENESRSSQEKFIGSFTLWKLESKGDKMHLRGFAWINYFAGLFNDTTSMDCTLQFNWRISIHRRIKGASRSISSLQEACLHCLFLSGEKFGNPRFDFASHIRLHTPRDWRGETCIALHTARVLLHSAPQTELAHGSQN